MVEAEELRGRLTYYEGFVSTHYNPTPHAWLDFDNARLDLTLLNFDGIYSGRSYSLEQVLKAYSRRGGLYFVDIEAIRKAARLRQGFRPLVF